MPAARATTRSTSRILSLPRRCGSSNGSPLPATVLWHSAATGNTADCHLGFTFGKPIITKLGGTWVVMFTSGYNNVNSPVTLGDGKGYLYVLDALTGQIIPKISTNAGTAVVPSGLAQINNFVDNLLN